MTNTDNKDPQIREAFEKHCQNPEVGGFKLNIERNIPPFDTEEYAKRDTQIAWLAWQAATEQSSTELKQLRAEQAGLLEDVEHILYRTAEARKDGVCSWSHCLNEIRAAAIKLKSRLTQTQNQQKGTDNE